MNEANPDRIDAIVLMSEYQMMNYEGPFKFIRDGGDFEVLIPVGDEPNELPEVRTAGIVDAEPSHERALVISDGLALDYGPINAIEEIDDWIAISVDSTEYLGPDESPQLKN